MSDDAVAAVTKTQRGVRAGAPKYERMCMRAAQRLQLGRCRRARDGRTRQLGARILPAWLTHRRGAALRLVPAARTRRMKN